MQPSTQPTQQPTVQPSTQVYHPHYILCSSELWKKYSSLRFSSRHNIAINATICAAHFAAIIATISTTCQLPYQSTISSAVATSLYSSNKPTIAWALRRWDIHHSHDKFRFVGWFVCCLFVCWIVCLIYFFSLFPHVLVVSPFISSWIHFNTI